jgi:hypothetical protein
MTEDADNPPHDTDAFLKAKQPLELFGEPLRAYSASRKVAAQTMGLLYPYVGDAGAERMQRTGVYPGALKDVIIVLWLCSIQDASEQSRDQVRAGEWNPSKALQKPEAAVDVAVEWASEKGLADIDSKEWTEAFAAFISIVQPVADSEFNVTTNPAPGDSEGNV